MEHEERAHTNSQHKEVSHIIETHTHLLENTTLHNASCFRPLRPTLFLVYGKLNSRIPARHYSLLFTATTQQRGSELLRPAALCELHNMQNPASRTDTGCTDHRSDSWLCLSFYTSCAALSHFSHQRKSRAGRMKWMDRCYWETFSDNVFFTTHS